MHCEVVDVNLASRSLELVELIRDQATHHFLALSCSQRDDMLFGEQTFEIGIARRMSAITVLICEYFGKQFVELAQRGEMSSIQSLN